MMDIMIKRAQMVLTRDSEDTFSVKLGDLKGGQWKDLYLGVGDSIVLDIPSMLVVRDELGANRTLTIKLNGKVLDAHPLETFPKETQP